MLPPLFTGYLEIGWSRGNNNEVVKSSLVGVIANFAKIVKRILNNKKVCTPSKNPGYATTSMNFKKSKTVTRVRKFQESNLNFFSLILHVTTQTIFRNVCTFAVTRQNASPKA